jgi:pimeloyl-ACP methyl ester carboxylesterase
VDRVIGIVTSMRLRRVSGSAGVKLQGYEWLPDVDGELPPVLLVHGLASNGRMWAGVARDLRRTGHHVVAIDQRGHGHSDKPDDGYDFTTVTDDLLCVLDDLRWRQAVVVGQSWGGNVVVELAWRAPERVVAAAAVDGGTIELSERFSTWDECCSAMAPPALEGMAASRLAAAMRAAHPDWPNEGIDGAMACFDVRDDGTVAPWLSRSRHLAILEALWGHRPSSRIAELSVPLLLVPALGRPGAVLSELDEDRLDRARRATGLSAKVAVHGIVGDHDLHAQHPAAVAELLHSLAVDAGSR